MNRPAVLEGSEGGRWGDDEAESSKRSARHIFKNAGITSMLGGLGVASGVVQDALILSTFGLGYQTDALFTAMTIPVLLTSVFAAQCPRVLIPVFARHLIRDEAAVPSTLLSNLLTTGFIALTLISLAGMTLSGIVVPLQIPGLGRNTISLAVMLSRILFWLVLAQGLATILQSALFAQQRFLIASSGKLVVNALTIAVLLFGRQRFGVAAVAVGTLLGTVAQLASLTVALSAHGFKYHWVCRPADPELREIARSFGYPVTGQIFSEAGTVLQNFLGSFLGSGNLTVIRYAVRIEQAVAGVFLGSVVQVTFPLMSRHAATNDVRAQRRTLLESIRLLALVGLPVCLWLIVAAKSMIVLLFEHGAFTRTDAVLTAVVLRLLVPDILLGRLASVAQTLFYANKDTRTPFISTVIYTASHTLFAIVLVRVLGVRGLPIAVSLASISFAGYMIVKVQKQFGPIGWSELLGFSVRLLGAAGVALAGFRLGTELAATTQVSFSLAKLLDFFVPTAFGICAFIVAAFAFGLIDRRLFLPQAAGPSLSLERS